MTELQLQQQVIVSAQPISKKLVGKEHMAVQLQLSYT